MHIPDLDWRPGNDLDSGFISRWHILEIRGMGRTCIEDFQEMKCLVSDILNEVSCRSKMCQLRSVNGRVDGLPNEAGTYPTSPAYT